jgi:hypothetical protein
VWHWQARMHRWLALVRQLDVIVRQLDVLERACATLHQQLLHSQREVVELNHERRRLLRRLSELEGRPYRPTMDSEEPDPHDWDTEPGVTVVVDQGRVTGVMDDGELVPIRGELGRPTSRPPHARGDGGERRSGRSRGRAGGAR